MENNTCCATTDIYCVSFKTSHPNRSHTFWFTDLEDTIRFNESLLCHPKTVECHIYRMKANICQQYLKDPGDSVTEVEMWRRGSGIPVRRGRIGKDSTGQRMEKDSTAMGQCR